MNRSRSSSWRRFICTTLLWWLALLLITNVGWSVWAAWRWQRTGFKDFIGSQSEMTGASIIERNRVHIWFEATGHRTRTRSVYFTHVVVANDRSAFDWRSPQNFSYADVAPVWVQRESARSLDLSWGWVESERPDQSGVFSQFYWSSGWPCRLLWSGVEKSILLERPMVIAGIPMLVGESYGLEDIVCLPVYPIWTGQLLTGAMWLGVVAAARALRYFLRYGLSDVRRRRGLCTRCAYDLRGNTSGVCPECGTPAQSHP